MSFLKFLLRGEKLWAPAAIIVMAQLLVFILTQYLLVNLGATVVSSVGLLFNFLGLYGALVSLWNWSAQQGVVRALSSFVFALACALAVDTLLTLFI